MLFEYFIPDIVGFSKKSSYLCTIQTKSVMIQKSLFIIAVLAIGILKCITSLPMRLSLTLSEYADGWKYCASDIMTSMEWARSLSELTRVIAVRSLIRR